MKNEVVIKRRVSGEQGFALFVILAAVAVSGVVVISMSNLSVALQKNERQLTVAGDLDQVSQALAMTLQDADLCTNALSSQKLQGLFSGGAPQAATVASTNKGKSGSSNGSANANSQVAAPYSSCLGHGHKINCTANLYTAEQAVNFDPNTPITNAIDITEIKLSDVNSSSKSMSLLSSGGKFGGVLINKMALLTDSYNFRYVGPVSEYNPKTKKVDNFVQYASNLVIDTAKDNPFGDKLKNRDSYPLIVYTQTDGSGNLSVVKCQNRKDMMVDNNITYVSGICGGIGGTYNANTQKCDYPPCSTGQYMVYDSSSGKMQCKLMAKVVIAIDLPSTKIGVGSQAPLSDPQPTVQSWLDGTAVAAYPVDSSKTHPFSFGPTKMSVCYCPYTLQGNACVNIGGACTAAPISSGDGREGEYDLAYVKSHLTHDDHDSVNDDNKDLAYHGVSDSKNGSEHKADDHDNFED